VGTLPQVAGSRIVRALGRAGFVVVRQKGSHAFMAHAEDPSRFAVVPVHGSQPIPSGALRSILAGAGLSVEEFRALL